MSQPNPFAQLLILYLTTPSSDFYLSKLIAGSANPTLEPFNASTVSLGSQTIMGVTMALSIQNLVIAGLSSVQVEKQGGVPVITVDGDNVTFVAQTPNTEAPPPNVPSQITLTGNLLVVPDSSPQFGGALTVTISQTTINGAFSASSSDGTAATVVIDFTQVTLNAAANSGNISIKLVMDNPLSSFINAVLNQAAILQQIVSGIQGQLAQPAILQALGQYATTAARAALG